MRVATHSTGANPDATQQRTYGHWLSVLAAFVFVVFGTGYCFSVPAEPFAHFDYFSMLADGFLHGRLSLDLPGPLLDMSQYNGKVYLYWGALNGLLHVPLQAL